MGLNRRIGQVAVASIALLAGVTGVEAKSAPEPLIVTRLPDPDPNFVPLPEAKLRALPSSDRLDGDSNLDQAMQNLGRTIGQAVQMEQQAALARCKSAIPSGLPDQQRWAWEANCSYRRH